MCACLGMRQVHTGRVALLLRLFPAARFVFIHRHPLEVFASAAHMADTYYWWARLPALPSTHCQPNPTKLLVGGGQAAGQWVRLRTQAARLIDGLMRHVPPLPCPPCPPAPSHRYTYLQRPCDATVNDFILDQGQMLIG
jgi:hypothetical protein